MVGYASSSDENGLCDKIIITVVETDDYPLEFSNDKKEIYSVSRDFTRVHKLTSGGFCETLSEEGLIKIARLLHSYEIKNYCACRISWTAGPDHIQVQKAELSDAAWFATPYYAEHCEDVCKNVTGSFFDHTPKILETSIVCDVLNYIISLCPLNMDRSFFNCANSVFCTQEILDLAACLFGDDLCPKPKRTILASFSGAKKLREKVVQSLKDIALFPEITPSGYALFFTEAKRHFIKEAAKALCLCIEEKKTAEEFCNLFMQSAKEFLDKISYLSHIFIEGDNIKRLNDIYYLTLYELHEAFCFYEARFDMKKQVAHSKERHRILSGFRLPVAVCRNQSMY